MGEVEGGGPYLQRKKNRKPTHHIPALNLHREGISTQLDTRIQHRLKIPRQAMTDASIPRPKRKARLAGIMRIRRRRREGRWFMDEGPDGLDVWVRFFRGGGCGQAGGGEVVDSLEHDDPGGIWGRGVLGGAGGDVGVEFRGGDGG